MTEITATYEQLIDDAVYSVSLYMARAAEAVDTQFGQGYAFNHPELVAAMVRAMAQEFSTSTACKVAEGIAERFS
jgi:hypothetical protein